MIDYNHYSHTHCWNQKSPACGQPLEDHKQCCLCDIPYPIIDSIDEMVRDFTQITPRPKSEVRRRINDLLSQEREKMEKNLEESAWAKAYKLMVEDELRAKICESVAGLKRTLNTYEPKTDDAVEVEILEYNQALQDVLKIINQNTQ